LEWSPSLYKSNYFSKILLEFLKFQNKSIFEFCLKSLYCFQFHFCFRVLANFVVREWHDQLFRTSSWIWLVGYFLLTQGKKYRSFRRKSCCCKTLLFSKRLRLVDRYRLFLVRFVAILEHFDITNKVSTVSYFAPK